MTTKNTIESINNWFTTAKPNATNVDVSTQTAFFIEEIKEVFEATNDLDVAKYLQGIKEDYLNLSKKTEYVDETINGWNREELLDGLCDVIVTCVGVANYLKMDIVGALEHVSQSNWSKFDENGKPILNEDGKITKGPNYFKPDLEPFV